MTTKETAVTLLKEWKGDRYVFGVNVLDKLGEVSKKHGKRALLVASPSPRAESLNTQVRSSLEKAGITIASFVPGAKPNAPREDVFRIATYILQFAPDFVAAVGGGSLIDSVKGAIVLAALGKEVTPEIDYYFGSGIVSEAYKRTGKKPLPLVAVQTVASSGSHLTKYANITDMTAGQKKLIVDEAVVPPSPFFDYAVTKSTPLTVTIDGALDAIAHTFEVFCGAKSTNADAYAKAQKLAQTAIDLVVEYTPTLIKDPANIDAREAVGLATDLGGYAIMVGGTSGGHLTSFSLVDVTAHGTACGIMNPYYAVFYGKAIQPQLKVVGAVFAKHGFIKKDLAALAGRDLAVTVAEGMIAFAKSINAPTTLRELPLFTDAHITRALCAAKDPQLAMKLQNMPVPLSAAEVDSTMAPILNAAASGDLSLIRA
ncbi:iron-containing alcohol dehydrogenase [Breznakiellaceae bacterium SP9]